MRRARTRGQVRRGAHEYIVKFLCPIERVSAAFVQKFTAITTSIRMLEGFTCGCGKRFDAQFVQGCFSKAAQRQPAVLICRHSREEIGGQCFKPFGRSPHCGTEIARLASPNPPLNSNRL